MIQKKKKKDSNILLLHYVSWDRMTDTISNEPARRSHAPSFELSAMELLLLRLEEDPVEQSSREGLDTWLVAQHSDGQNRRQHLRRPVAERPTPVFHP